MKRRTVPKQGVATVNEFVPTPSCVFRIGRRKTRTGWLRCDFDNECVHDHDDECVHDHDADSADVVGQAPELAHRRVQVEVPLFDERKGGTGGEGARCLNDRTGRPGCGHLDEQRPSRALLFINVRPTSEVLMTPQESGSRFRVGSAAAVASEGADSSITRRGAR